MIGIEGNQGGGNAAVAPKMSLQSYMIFIFWRIIFLSLVREIFPHNSEKHAYLAYSE